MTLGALLHRLVLVGVLCLTAVAQMPSAHAGSVTLYNHDCGAHTKSGTAQISVWAPHEGAPAEEAECTFARRDMAPNTYSDTIALVATGYEGATCRYMHLAKGIAGVRGDDDITGSETACVTCRKEGFMKLCRCKKVSCP